MVAGGLGHRAKDAFAFAPGGVRQGSPGRAFSVPLEPPCQRMRLRGCLRWRRCTFKCRAVFGPKCLAVVFGLDPNAVAVATPDVPRHAAVAGLLSMQVGWSWLRHRTPHSTM